jgi:hypothetical protein
MGLEVLLTDSDGTMSCSVAGIAFDRSRFLNMISHKCDSKLLTDVPFMLRK